jgi:hypothetical protein
VTTATQERHRTIEERLASDTPFYAQTCLKIVDKDENLVPFRPNAAQLAFDAVLEKQRAAGQPMRAIVLKARQVGMSTWIQGKLIQRATQRANHSAFVVAHDTKTGMKLYRMAEKMYGNLPDEIKPPLGSYSRGRKLHFNDPSRDAWTTGSSWPDSIYEVDTAGEYESGRGGTYHSLHASELAFWGDAETKLTALKGAVPRRADTLLVIESTANGHNVFKELWDEADSGRGGYAAFFWPWWKQAEYTLPFMNESEREAFEIGSGPWGEEEPDLLDPGPVDTLTGKHVPLTLEQLNWRRETIRDESNGKLETFHQEYPTDPEQAFLSTGSRVFDARLVRGLLVEMNLHDPRVGTPETPGPIRGSIRSGKVNAIAGRSGLVQAPSEPEFVGRDRLGSLELPDWRVWLPPTPEGIKIPEEGRYIIGADVSAGLPESDEGDPAYHALQVIDHKTKIQVAEYRSRVDPNEFADVAYLAAMFFNNAWLAIEVTGSYGLPAARKIAQDYHYAFMYRRRSHDKQMDKVERKLGWNTGRDTKPILLAGGQELLREGTHGIRSRLLAMEMLTYVRHPNGSTGPQKKKFADLLMAWLIAQQVALEIPLALPRSKRKAPPRFSQPRDPVTGY